MPLGSTDVALLPEHLFTEVVHLFGVPELGEGVTEGELQDRVSVHLRCVRREVVAVEERVAVNAVLRVMVTGIRSASHTLPVACDGKRAEKVPTRRSNRAIERETTVGKV